MSLNVECFRNADLSYLHDTDYCSCYLILHSDKISFPFLLLSKDIDIEQLRLQKMWHISHCSISLSLSLPYFRGTPNVTRVHVTWCKSAGNNLDDGHGSVPLVFWPYILKIYVQWCLT